MLDTVTKNAAVFDVDLAALRALSRSVPGPLPLAVNAVRFAASVRPRKFVIEGGDETPVTMPRTAYQVVYPDGTVMLDAGMDKATHDSFGEGEPYDNDAFDSLKRALDEARMIVLTHYHADHAGGVVTAENFDALARKTVATSKTLSLMTNQPHRPHLKIDAQQAAAFIALDDQKSHPLAPGLVLIDAPGHSPDMQMVFITLQSGREILHSVDAAWSMDNIAQCKGKAAPWVKEDKPAVMAQLAWLKSLTQTEPDIDIIVTHDGDHLDRLIAKGTIGGALKH